MSPNGHKGPQSSHEIAKNLQYVERLTNELVSTHGEKLAEMYRIITRVEMAELLLPRVNINAAKSALRNALKQLMDPEEMRKIAHERWSEAGERNARTFTPEERALGQANRTHTSEDTKRLVESRGDALWTHEEEQLLVDMMKAGNDIQAIADAVSKVAKNPRNVSACRGHWLVTKLITDKNRKKITKNRQIASARGFTDEERERGHTFDDTDRANAIESLGLTPWSPEEDSALAELRQRGKKFREIATEINSQFKTERTTSGCIGRYYVRLKLGTRKRKKRSAVSGD